MSKATLYKLSLVASIWVTCAIPLSLTTGSVVKGMLAAVAVSAFKAVWILSLNAAWKRFGNYEPIAKS